MSFICQVCFEEREKKMCLPKLTTGNGDVLRKDECQHPICEQCLSTFVATRVQEQFVFNVRCPSPGCANEIYAQDLVKLVASSTLQQNVSERFAELRSRDFSARAKELHDLIELEANDQLDLIYKIWDTTRLCPRCSCAIEKSQGCNSFYCICGHHFDYAAAPRVFGNGVKSYGKVIRLAQKLKLKLRAAEEYGSDRHLGKPWSEARALATHRQVSRIAAEVKLDMDSALKLQQQAKAGNCDARLRIREARDQSYLSEELEDGAWNETEMLQHLAQQNHSDLDGDAYCLVVGESIIKDTARRLAADWNPQVGCVLRQEKSRCNTAQLICSNESTCER
jgi:hypothetical protein